VIKTFKMSPMHPGLLLVAILASLLAVSRGQYYYTIDGVEECGEVEQLWYDGYWKEVCGAFLGFLEFFKKKFGAPFSRLKSV
jgi:hypothetical protein